MIRVIVVDKHQIVCDGIKTILNETNDINVIDCVSRLDVILPKLNSLASHLLMINIYHINDNIIDTITKICTNHPKVKVLINAMFDNEHFLMKSIKAGAKGYLSKDDGANEMKEAIYTLHNGHDYHGKSISNILLSNFLKQDKSKQLGLEHLTEREREVLKLFSESLTNREISEKLFISIRTVETHKTNIMKKINLKTTVDLVKFAIRNNLIKL
ncbi:MAG: response regulator transcription factor [Bacteroidota bacterium]|nr:response regulator transcription factor [Bacteroidota bacterium]